MLAKEKWQIGTINVLEMVFQERIRQIAKHGEAMRDLPDGTGPEVEWLVPVAYEAPLDATSIEKVLREEYDLLRGEAEEPGEALTRMHIVREEVAEMFKEDGDSDEFIAEAIQVAALCVQWVEYKLENRRVQH